MSLAAAGSLFGAHAAFDPGKPKNLKATADGPHAVELTWDRERRAEYYRVYRDGDLVGEREEERYRDEGLDPETTYVYRVSAVDDHGDEGDKSDPVSVTTDPLPGPSAPEGLEATAAGPFQVDLAWRGSESDAGIAFYRVYRDGSEISTASDTVFADAGVEPDTEYTYRVSAVDVLGGESPPSAPATVRTPAEPGPSAPTNLQAAPEPSGDVQLTWTRPADAPRPIQGYRVYRDGQAIGFVTSTAFIDTDVAFDTQYRYAVSAVDDRGVEGERSAEVSVTTPPPPDLIPPAPPTGLRVVVG